jgi:hypothetical protein
MKDLLKLLAAWAAFVLATIATGVVTTVLHLRPITIPGQTSVATQLLLQLAGGAVLVLGLYPLARGLSASAAVRSVALGAFLFFALGVNGTIEGKFFTHFFDGKVAAAAVYYSFLALLVGATLGWLFGRREPPAGLPHRSPLAWAGRTAAAWLA